MEAGKKIKWKQTLVYIVFGVMALLVIYPLFWIIINSLKNNDEFYRNSFGIPKELKWENYVEAWETGISEYFVNSILITVCTVVGIVIISTLAVYAVTRLKFRHRRLILFFLVGGMFVSPQTAVLPLYDLLRDIKMYNTYGAMIVPIMAFRVSFTIFLLYPAFQEFPRELEEAAILDGCSKMQIYFRLFFPICKPAIMSSVLLNMIYAWNEFTFSLNFISEEKYYTIPIGLMSFSQALYTNWVVLLAGIVLTIVPVLLILMGFQKYFVNGLTAGSVKG